MTNIINKNIIIATVLIALASLFLLFSMKSQSALGSVEVSNEYNATTTFAGHTKDSRLLKTGAGSLGSVIITGDNTGFIRLYNATTSNINNRTGNVATSSLLIADFPASSPEGTYTFDSNFTTGLLMITVGNQATSTITWR